MTLATDQYPLQMVLNAPIQPVWQGVFEEPADPEQANKVFRTDEGLKQNIIKLSTYLSEL